MKRIQSIRAGHRQSIKVRKEGLEIILYTLYSDIPHLSVVTILHPFLNIVYLHLTIALQNVSWHILHHSVPIDIKFSIVWLSIYRVSNLYSNTETALYLLYGT